MECKVVFGTITSDHLLVLIETLWNVKSADKPTILVDDAY